jgi:hypothetical protein
LAKTCLLVVCWCHPPATVHLAVCSKSVTGTQTHSWARALRFKVKGHSPAKHDRWGHSACHSLSFLSAPENLQ